MASEFVDPEAIISVIEKSCFIKAKLNAGQIDWLNKVFFKSFCKYFDNTKEILIVLLCIYVVSAVIGIY